MRVEDLGEGNEGMLMVGNVSVNSVIANHVIKGEYYHPVTNSLWFYTPRGAACRVTWYGNPMAGSYKNHYFYQPEIGVCSTIR